MALVIPTAASTFGDSTTTEGGRLRKYVLAQFRNDSDLKWVRELRAVLVRDELKYRNVKESRPELKQNRQLWGRVENGVAQASIIVVDPQPFDNAIRMAIESEGANNLPPIDEKDIHNTCATAIVRSTPIAYLPDELSKAVPWGFYQEIATLDDFSPQNIREMIGGGLKQAMIFAARAHATFDLENIDETAASTRDVLRSPLARVLLAELLSTSRVFDTENPLTVQVLNNASDLIAKSVGEQLPTIGSISSQPLVREINSRVIDEIQAADIAAGWARDLLEVAEPKALGSTFERVWLNGKRIK